MITYLRERSPCNRFLALAGVAALGWLLLLVQSRPSWADEPGKVETSLRAARKARRAGCYTEAARHLESFRVLGGAREVSRLEKALTEAQQGDIGRVEKYLRGLLEKKDRPEASLILESLTLGYLQNLQFAEAEVSLKAWHKTKLVDAQGFYLRGQALTALPSAADNGGRRVAPPEAIKDYHRALAVDARHEAAGLALAEALLDSEKVEEARPLFDAVLKQSPDNPRALLGQSRCLRRMGKLMEAQAQLEKLLAKHPRHVEGLTERAGIDLFNGKFESAEPLLRKAVELQPHNFQANYHLVICLRRLGRAKETAQATRRMHQIRVDITRFVDLEKSVLEKPGDPAPRCEAGVLLLGLGEQRDGVRWLTSALRVDPRHRPAHKALAEHYERIGKKDLAEKHHRLARE